MGGMMDELQDAISKRRKKANEHQNDWRRDASQAYTFVAGDQWDDTDKLELERLKKPCVTFNRVGPIINAICGQQVCNRQETRFLPREINDATTADQWTQIVSWVREQCDAEDEESDAFRDLVITGMGWTKTEVKYDEDPQGKIVVKRIDPRRMRWDQTARQKNLSDARWVQCDYWYTLQELQEEWPQAGELDIQPGAIDNDVNVESPHDATNDWRYLPNNAGKDVISGRYRVIHDIFWKLETVFQIAEPTGEVSVLSPEDYKALTERLTAMGMPMPQAAQTKKRKYYETWLCGGTILESGEYAIESGFEYQSMTGLRDEDGDWYGIAKALIDPQKFANKIFSQILSIINSNAKGGIIVESSAVTNQRKFEQDWSKSDGVSWVEDGGIGKISPKPPPQIPTQLQQLLEYSIGGMREVTGVNVEFLGQTDKVQPGVVEAMRTKAGLVILAPWFDAMRLYMKRQGRVLAEFINKYIADGRWIRVTGDQGPQFMQLARQPGVLRYDIIVDESTASRDTKERAFLALMQIVPMALQTGIPVPPEVIDYAPIPETLRMKWKQQIQQKMSEPKQPPIQVVIEQMRQQGKQIENQQKMEWDKQKAYLDAQEQRVTQAAQAESERMIQHSKLQMEAWLGNMELINDKQRMQMEAKLSTFETVLNAIVDLQKASAEQNMRMQENQQKQMMIDESKVEGESNSTATIMQAIMQLQQNHAENFQQLARIMSAPDEVIRDKNGRISGRRKVVTIQ